MRIAIVGAGAMGSLFGAMLSSVSDVYLITLSEEHVQAIKKNGLVIEKTDGTSETYQMFATTDASEVEPDVDLAIIFTKSYSTEAAAKSAKPLLGRKGLAITLQNGLGNLEVIANIVGKERAIAGVTSHGATLVEPGHIRHAGEGPTYIGSISHLSQSLNRIAETFQAGGINVSVSENLDSLIWGKLIINVGINALAAILRVPNGVLGVTPECKKIMSNAVLEAETVARAFGIELPYANPLEAVKKVCENTAGNRASMLQDILKGAHTEVGAINRAIVKRGKVLGISTPYNVFLSEIIEALEATSEKRF
ncbi:ketopantoate reductase family protein [Desulfonema magnum]|uniref:2-dehydropantoate 2-reductase n=1 Tax=Desulfonema magnum TaxID=45655 RepID=A0A975BN42_9BACT|nr:2-dehydropantoate 2-reductase [Desulfonema magnum]QTA88521.1 2-dehydropantoate 2-reductase [Desulfonema magnum]